MLRVADTINTHGILKAAAALGISQPALTKTLQELEGIVQIRLFDRHARRARNRGWFAADHHRSANTG